MQRRAIEKHYAQTSAHAAENFMLVSASGKQVKQAVLALIGQSAQPFGLASTYIGPVTSMARVHQSLGTAGSYCGVPQLQYLNCLDDTVSQPGISSVSAFGVQTSTPALPTTITGHHIIFIGSTVAQPDMLLVQHLITATLDLKTIAQNCYIQSAIGQSMQAAIAEMLSAYAGVGMSSSHELQSASLVEGILIAAPADVAVKIIQHYQTTWNIAELVSNVQVVDIGTVQAEPNRSEFEFKPAAGQWRNRAKEPSWTEVRELEPVILRLLAHPEISPQPTQPSVYDTTVLGDTIVEPNMADAAVVAPLLEINNSLGIALASSSNSRYAIISPYWQSINAVVDSVRKIVASGAQPWSVSVQYSHVEQDTLQLAFTESVRGIQEVVTGLDLSLTRQDTIWYSAKQLQATANPWPTIVHALGKLDDVASAITLDFIQPGNIICLVGPRRNELGGSILYTLYNEIGSQLPQPDLGEVNQELRFMMELIRQRLIPTCHAIGRGGLIKTLADMCYGASGDLRTGIEVDLAIVPSAKLTATQKLFSETGGFIFEADPRLLPSLQRHAATYQVEFYSIGKICDNEIISIHNGATTVLNIPVGTLAEEWLRGWLSVV